MPWHLQDPSESLYAKPACGASYLTGGTTGIESGLIDCTRCRAAIRATAENGESK